jgi:hypothetical protein
MLTTYRDRHVPQRIFVVALVNQFVGETSLRPMLRLFVCDDQCLVVYESHVGKSTKSKIRPLSR